MVHGTRASINSSCIAAARHTAHEKWEEPLSDIITILKAVGAYECALQSGDSTFCAKYYLHEKVRRHSRLQLAWLSTHSLLAQYS